MQSIDTRQEQAQEDSSPMNVLPQIRLVKGLRALRPWLAALMFFLPGLLSAQSVPISTSGVVSIGGVPRVYNGRYVLQLSDYGFFWLDTTTLTPGHVQAVPKCGVGMPPSDSNLYPLGDCNTITDVTTSSSQVLVRLTSGQCRSMSRGCGGPRDDGHWGFLFGLGNWQYLGDATDPYLLLGNTFSPTGATGSPPGAGPRRPPPPRRQPRSLQPPARRRRTSRRRGAATRRTTTATSASFRTVPLLAPRLGSTGTSTTRVLSRSMRAETRPAREPSPATSPATPTASPRALFVPVRTASRASV